MNRLLFVAALLASTVAAAPAPPQYHVAGQLPAGDGGWDLLSVASADQRLYVAHGDGVTAFDLRTGKATDKIVAGQRVHAALAIPGTHDVLSTNGASDNAFLFDGRTGRIRAAIPTGKNPDAAAYDWTTKTVWIMNPGSGDITVVDPRSAKVLDTIPVGGSLEMATSDVFGHMYVNVEDRNEVAIFDTRTRKLIRRFALDGCEGPTGIAYNPSSTRHDGPEILSACGNGVAVISTLEGKQVARLPIGKGADGAAYDSERDVAFVPAGRDGTLTLMHLFVGPAVIGQVKTAVSARTIGIDNLTGRVYLPSAVLAPAPAGERPKPVPGTFRVLVVAP